jgi:hypothetical protein
VVIDDVIFKILLFSEELELIGGESPLEDFGDNVSDNLRAMR